MPARTRTIGNTSPSPLGGTLTRSGAAGGTVNSPNRVQSFSQCQDVVDGTRNPHPLTITRETFKEGKRMSGTYVSGSTTFTTNGYYPGYAGTETPTLSLPTVGPTSANLTKALARTNPSRPYVDASVFIGELRDFPSLARDIWKDVATLQKGMQRTGRGNNINDLDKAVRSVMANRFKNVDRNWLAYHFGWAPFVGDIMKFLNAGDIVDKRVDELTKLAQQGYLSRKFTLNKVSNVQVSNKTIQSLYIIVNGRETLDATADEWISVRWKLNSWSPLKGNSKDNRLIRNRARLAVYGAVPDLSTAWNLMPWSWLIDWGTDMGDWLSAKRNLVGAYPDSLCYMKHATYNQRVVSLSGGAFACNWSSTREVKSRSVHSPPLLPSASFNILSAKQVSILAALATSRARGK